MTRTLTMAWTDAIEGVRESPSPRCVVLAAAGSAFCAGANLSWLDQGSAGEATPDQLRQRMLPFYRAWLLHKSLAVPIIAAVNGPALTAGLCLMLACDLRYASPSAVPRTLRAARHPRRTWCQLAPQGVGGDHPDPGAALHGP